MRNCTPLLPSSSDELHFERQSKVLGRQIAHQKRIVLQSRTAADDFAVLDRPQLRVARPAGQIAAVEEQAGVVLRGQHRHLRFAAQVGEQRQNLVRRELLELIVGHHRRVAQRALVDFVLGQHERFGRRADRDRLVVLRA